jgi:hypothetical protein
MPIVPDFFGQVFKWRNDTCFGQILHGAIRGKAMKRKTSYAQPKLLHLIDSSQVAVGAQCNSGGGAADGCMPGGAAGTGCGAGTGGP